MTMCIYCGDRVGIVCDNCASTAQERDLLRNLIKKYVRHVQDCEGVHYINRTDGSGRSSLTEEEQKMLLKIANVQEEY